nr:uroporphyrinogen decarboxylase family protein [uncultured Sphaerochaeta sp.]
MTKKERVIAAILKKPVDFVPSGFSLHFPKEKAHGREGVKSHLSFFKETDTDICKIMNENLVPSFGSFTTADDYKKIPTISVNDEFMQKQLQMTTEIMEQTDTNSFMVGTLHGILASAIHPLEQHGMSYESARTFLVDALRNNPEPVLSAMQRITDGMCELAHAYTAIGIDGIYYAALGAERHYFTDEEFSRWIEPFDRQILAAIKESGAYSFLHMCKENLNLNRYIPMLDLVDVVNWGVYEVPFSLQDGKALFKDKTIMGGLPNHTGVLFDGSRKEITDAVQKLIRQMGSVGFIIGADCTLATDQNIALIKAVTRACRSDLLI